MKNKVLENIPKYPKHPQNITEQYQTLQNNAKQTNSF